jgi:phosphatidate cytidylyltransferase
VLKRVLTAAVLIPLVVIAVFYAPLRIFAIVVAAIALLALREYFNIVESYGLAPLRTYIYIVVVLLFARSWTVGNLEAVTVAAGLSAFVLPALIMRRAELRGALPVAAASLFPLFYLVLPLLLIIDMRHFDGPGTVMALLGIVWVGDTAAYFVGRGIGRHLLAPRTSPKKTWEGAAASLVGGAAVGVVWWMLAHRSSGPETWVSTGYLELLKAGVWSAVAMAVIVNIAAQLGDLVESVIKRGANVKDSGSILPGHGGMLDRIDALLFAAPVMYYYPVFFHRVFWPIAHHQ